MTQFVITRCLNYIGASPFMLQDSRTVCPLTCGVLVAFWPNYIQVSIVRLLLCYRISLCMASGITFLVLVVMECVITCVYMVSLVIVSFSVD